MQMVMPQPGETTTAATDAPFVQEDATDPVDPVLVDPRIMTTGSTMPAEVDMPVMEAGPEAQNAVIEAPVAEVPVSETAATETPAADPAMTTPATTEVACDAAPEVSGEGQGWGDPHFIGADGEKYDVQGEAGKFYNLLSDRDIQVNAKFDTWSTDMNVMKEIGITTGGKSVQIGLGGDVTVDGQKIATDGTYLDGLVTRAGNKVTVKTPEYTVAVSGNDYLDVTFSGKNVQADGVMPTGIWGVTLDGDGKARTSGGYFGTEGGSMQGGGVLERADGSISDKNDVSTYKEYEVTSLMDLMFPTHNRYAA
jgi:hypothetical protein